VPVDEPNTIDILSVGADGALNLTISDHLDWADSIAHQLTLQTKMNAYLRFIESGEVFEHRPECAGTSVVIRVVFKHQPDPDGLQFLDRAKVVIGNAGFGFEYRVG
jgi:hypothetical protein